MEYITGPVGMHPDRRCVSNLAGQSQIIVDIGLESKSGHTADVYDRNIATPLTNATLNSAKQGHLEWVLRIKWVDISGGNTCSKMIFKIKGTIQGNTQATSVA